MSMISNNATIVHNKQFETHAQNLAAARAVAGKTTATFGTTFERNQTSSGVQAANIRYIDQVGQAINATDPGNFSIGGQGMAVVNGQATKPYTERAMPMDPSFQQRPIKMPGEMTNVPPGFDDAENIVMREISEPNLTTEQLRQKRLDYFDSVGAQQHRSTSIEM